MRCRMSWSLALGLFACGGGSIGDPPAVDAPPGLAPDAAATDGGGAAIDGAPGADAAGAAPDAASLLPAKIVGGYLECWEGVLPRELPAGYNLLYHAFATLDADARVDLYIAADRADLAADVWARRAAGQPTILSIGGAGGAEAGLNGPDELDAFLTSVEPVIDELGFAGIDWDLELDVPGGISVDGVVAASRALRATYGPDFLITMAPFDSVESVYREIATALGGDLAYVGYQFYNRGEVPTAAIVLDVMESWLADCGLREDQFAIGFWHGPDDWLGLVTPYARMADIYEAVNAAHPGVRGVYTWGVVSTDGADGWRFVDTLAPVVLGSPAP